MALRMISYGYKMVNGILSIVEDEARIVVEIFQRYVDGEYLKDIADDLTNRKVIYYQEKSVWNKNMIARIIENRKYIGHDGYPRIISDDDFDRANDLKSQKGNKKIVCNSEIEYMKGIITCAQCGHKLYRCANWSSREKWFCPSGCKTDIYMGDWELTAGIVNALNYATLTPECLKECEKVETYRPDLEVVRQNNEINRFMDQPNVQFQAVKKLILQCAEKRFLCCSDNKADAHTEYVCQCFAAREVSGSLDIAFMQKVVDGMALEKDGSIIITLINRAQIKGRK